MHLLSVLSWSTLNNSKCTLLMLGAVHSSGLNSTFPQASFKVQMLLGPWRKTH